MRIFRITTRHSQLTDVSTPHLPADLGFRTWSKISEITTSADVDYVEFTGLDINTDKVYLIFVNARNSDTANNNNLALYVNDDNTATNYYRAVIRGLSAGTQAGTGNESAIVQSIPAGEYYAGFLYVMLGIDGKMRAYGTQQVSTGSDIRVQSTSVVSVNTFTNITKIRLQATTSLGIAQNSYFLLSKPIT